MTWARSSSKYGLVARLVLLWLDVVTVSSAATLVEERTCAGCHASQIQDWQGSHHQLAMQAADESSVKGDFNDVTFHGERELTVFFRRGEEFWVKATDAQGIANDFKVAYAFGVAPLQQYLLETSGGRLQALNVAWDTAKGGWFTIYPGQGVDFRDPLHWSKPGQNANFMCVECHTTGFKRNFDASTNTFDSQWNSLGVGCQACHGPGSDHVTWAGSGAQRSAATGVGFAVDLTQADNAAQADTCARCHSRRASLADDSLPGKPLLDAYLPSALTAELYEVDGKIKGEVFEHGSFLQSKMFAKGVACTACHNPHSTELKASGDAVCLQCHNTVGKTVVPGVDARGLKAKDYLSPEHHHHVPGSAGSQCIACHMPGKLFMVNDLRHDHSFSLPNPALAQRLGTPDACIGCHRDMPAEQLIERYTQWYGTPRNPTFNYAESLWLARAGLPGAADALFGELATPTLSAIRRTTLLAEVADYPSERALASAVEALTDADAQVRETAVKTVAAQLPGARRAAVLGASLSDPILAVRLASASALLEAGPSLGRWQSAFDKALAEYETTQLQLQERAEANLNLALLYQSQGQIAKVEPYLRTAIERDPDFAPAVVALGQWLESQRLPEEALALLSAHLLRTPNSALLQFTQGLTLIRQRQAGMALLALREANRLEPSNARYAYVLALAMQSLGEVAAADALLAETLQLHPQDREVRMAIIVRKRSSGDAQSVRQLIEDLRAINPGDPLVLMR
ncbi:hypothetical protein IFT98_03230 [Pseudomonas sp. CFBP 8770]|uniref:cytochrome c3 family protein n=1 Tax=unclassified Pseudomonas TaxID=196821 RepID=UPI001780E365|nr:MULTISPECIES: cytochrome c3 family protein [unclassified Pseudomonas]MBD8472903.1 hypothetical protein [Pseudomonas sp. CFBP 8773]MBD8645994.1 hypothetical protein [Pseudomonas sp. CFBP 8770]